MKRRIAAVVVLALSAMTLVGTNAGASGQAAKQKSGGTFRMMLTTEVTTWDPISIAFNTSGPERYHSIFGAVAVPDPKTGTIKPEIAQSITTPDKGLTWVLKFRPGVKFSDGTVFDANAVKFNWDRQADPALKGVHLTAMGALASYVVTDAQTITVTLKQVNTQWPTTLANELSFIGSPTAIRAAGAGFATKPVAAGPFVLESWTRGSQMVLARNTSYYGAKPFVDKVVISIQPDPAQLENAFLAGAIEAFSTTNDATVERLRSQATVKSTPGFTGYGFGFDVTKAPFDDPNVRKAIALAINAKEMATTAERPVMTTFFPTGSAWYDPSLKYPKTDMAQAQKLINTYIAAHGGTPLKLTFALTTGGELLAQVLQAQLQRLTNVTVSLNFVIASGYTSGRLAHQYSFFFTDVAGLTPEPAMFNTFASTGSTPYFQYSNPTVDAALAKARTVTNADQATQSYRQAAAQIIKDNVFVPVWLNNSNNLVQKSIVLRSDSIFYRGLLDFATVSFKKPS